MWGWILLVKLITYILVFVAIHEQRNVNETILDFFMWLVVDTVAYDQINGHYVSYADFLIHKEILQKKKHVLGSF